MVNSSEDEASVGSSKSGQELTPKSSPTTPHETATQADEQESGQKLTPKSSPTTPHGTATQADEQEASTISLLLESTLAVLFC